MIVPLTALAALLPSVLLVWFFHRHDAHPEPSRVLWATFGLGVLTVFPVLVVALPVQAGLEQLALGPWTRGTLDAFLCAALPEEAFKLLVLFAYAARHRAFDEPMDGVVYGVVASLGFATFENVLYTADGGLVVATLRAFTAVPMHALCGAVMGYYVGRWRFPAETGGGPGSLVAAYAWPTLFHGLYDAPLLALKPIAAGLEGRDPTAGELLAVLAAAGFALAVLATLAVVGLVLLARARRQQRDALARGRLEPLIPVLPDLGPAGPAGAAPRAVAPLAPLPGNAPGAGVSCLLLLVGGGLVSLAGVFALVGAFALVAPDLPADERRDVLLGAVVLATPTLLLGLGAFVWGARRLPRPAPRRSRFGAEG